MVPCIFLFFCLCFRTMSFKSVTVLLSLLFLTVMLVPSINGTDMRYKLIEKYLKVKNTRSVYVLVPHLSQTNTYIDLIRYSSNDGTNYYVNVIDHDRLNVLEDCKKHAAIIWLEPDRLSHSFKFVSNLLLRNKQKKCFYQLFSFACLCFLLFLE